MKKLFKINFEGLITDISIIIIAILLRQGELVVFDNLNIFIWFLGLLQAATLYSVFLGWKISKAKTEEMSDLMLSFYTITIILAIGGFLWLFLPSLLLE